MEFRGAYIAYLQRQLDRLVGEGSILAVGVKHAMSKNAINNVLNEYEIKANSSLATRRDVFARIAPHDDDIFIDLCNPNWEAIRITAGGWSIVESPPVRFRRTRGMLPLPYPERGGKIEALRPFFNLKTEADFTVVVGYVLAALRPFAPYPILNPIGPPGAAKTRLLRLIRRLVDPNGAETTPLPPETAISWPMRMSATSRRRCPITSAEWRPAGATAGAGATRTPTRTFTAAAARYRSRVSTTS